MLEASQQSYINDIFLLEVVLLDHKVITILVLCVYAPLITKIVLHLLGPYAITFSLQ